MIQTELDFDDDREAVAALAQTVRRVVDAVCGGGGAPPPVTDVLAAARACVPLAQGAGVVVERSGRLQVLAATTAVPGRLVELEQRVGAGPVGAALGAAEPVVCPDLVDDGRWPGYADAVAARLRARSLVAYRLLPGAGERAVLLIHSDWPEGIDGNAVNQGAVLASCITLALRAAGGSGAPVVPAAGAPPAAAAAPAVRVMSAAPAPAAG